MDVTAAARALRPLARLGRSLLHPSGLVGALVFFCASLTPTIIPRHWAFQALVTGASTAAGYAAGLVVGWLGRRLGVRPGWTATARRRGWIALGAAAAVCVPLFLVLGAMWQRELRELFGMADFPPAHSVLVTVVALVVALVFLGTARGVRGTARAVTRLLLRWVPLVVARVAGALLVAVAAVLLLNGTVNTVLLGALSSSSAALDRTTAEGIVPPTAPERSGSPDSPVAWDTLGFQGRSFVAGGPSVAEIADFTATTDRARAADVEVREPIRVYAGLGSADGLDETAALVVDELDRTDAWDRAVLVVATATGTGWIDPSMSETLELLYGGDTAIASMQYSYLPSWVAFIADRSVPPVAGTALFDAVHEAWSQHPEGHRPKLLVFGESLGSFGSQGAFGGLQDVTTRTDGALWIGTPSFTENWATLTRDRDAGSPEFGPVYEGGAQVRWGTDPGSAANVWDLGPDWDTPRVVYVQHGSDAVTWWSTDLILHEPDWMREPPAPDVLPAVTWLPVVSFLQVTADMMVAAEVPPGFGHNFHLEYSDAWAAVAPPDGWTDADTLALRALMATKTSES
ncbi:alpha/beta hydrolase [Cellulomonas hominis]